MGDTRMKNPETVYKYLKAGNATVTLTDTRDGCWFTYRILKNRTKGKGWSIYLMVQPEKFVYIGAIKAGMFQHNGGSRVVEESRSFGLFDSLILGLTKKWSIPHHLEVRHAGQCGRCGKTLTTPKSIETGLGPVCFKLVQ